MSRNTVRCSVCGSETRVIRVTHSVAGDVVRRHQCIACGHRFSVKAAQAKSPEQAEGGGRSLSAAEASRPKKYPRKPKRRPAKQETRASDRTGGMPVGPVPIIEGLKFDVDF